MHNPIENIKMSLLYAYAVGSGLSLYRNPLLGAVELASGMSQNDSANMRLFGTATNFLLTGPFYAGGRDILEQKVLPRFGIKKSVNTVDRLYGAGMAVAEIGVNLIFYNLISQGDFRQTIIPSVASWALTFFRGADMGKAIDSFKDSCGLSHNDLKLLYYARIFCISFSKR